MPEENISPNPNQSQTPAQSVESKPNNLAKYLLFGFLGLTLLVSVTYWYGTRRAQQPREPKVVSQPSPSEPAVGNVGIEPTPRPPKSSFQNLLSEQCKKFGDSVDVGVLPVVVDESVLDVRSVMCRGDSVINAGYVQVSYGDGETLNLYDEYSKELGHGGSPFLGTYRKSIKETADVRLSIYFARPDGGPALVGDVAVIVRGQKKIRLRSGETIFINAEHVAIEGDDPRLVAVLDKYSRESDRVAGRREIINDIYEDLIDAAEVGIVKRFFDDLAILGDPERGNIRKLENILDTVTAR